MLSDCHFKQDTPSICINIKPNFQSSLLLPFSFLWIQYRGRLIINKIASVLVNQRQRNHGIYHDSEFNQMGVLVIYNLELTNG